jgi:hypothetical protein
MNLKHFFLFLGVERFNNALPHAVVLSHSVELATV